MSFFGILGSLWGAIIPEVVTIGPFGANRPLGIQIPGGLWGSGILQRPKGLGFWGPGASGSQTLRALGSQGSNYLGVWWSRGGTGDLPRGRSFWGWASESLATGLQVAPGLQRAPGGLWGKALGPEASASLA